MTGDILVIDWRPRVQQDIDSSTGYSLETSKDVLMHSCGAVCDTGLLWKSEAVSLLIFYYLHSVDFMIIFDLLKRRYGLLLLFC